MNEETRAVYAERRERYLVFVAERLETLMRGYLADEPRIDRVSARAKMVDSFVEKANKRSDGKAIYDDPLNQIQDQIGARIIVFFESDISRMVEVVNRYFRQIEDRLIVPDRESEFGYFGRHFILLCPSDIFQKSEEKDNCPNFFELQIKTLYQHAWSEANHDLGYKGNTPLSQEERRKIAFTAAQSWGADIIFDELFTSKS